jgi:hypothetical protein
MGRNEIFISEGRGPSGADEEEEVELLRVRTIEFFG